MSPKKSVKEYGTTVFGSRICNWHAMVKKKSQNHNQFLVSRSIRNEHSLGASFLQFFALNPGIRSFILHERLGNVCLRKLAETFSMQTVK